MPRWNFIEDRDQSGGETCLGSSKHSYGGPSFLCARTLFPSSPPLLLYKHQVADRHSQTVSSTCPRQLPSIWNPGKFWIPTASWLCDIRCSIGSFLFQCRTAFISLFICRDFNEARCIVSETVIFVVLPCALCSLLIWNSACQRSSLSLYLLKLQELGLPLWWNLTHLSSCTQAEILDKVS